MADRSADIDHDSVPPQLPQPFLLFFHSPSLLYPTFLPPLLQSSLNYTYLPLLPLFYLLPPFLHLSWLPVAVSFFILTLFLLSFLILPSSSPLSFLHLLLISSYGKHIYFALNLDVYKNAEMGFNLYHHCKGMIPLSCFYFCLWLVLLILLLNKQFIYY